MPRLIAFLRGINVGRGRVVKMEWLRGQFAGLGFSRVETYIASGNMIFESRAQNAAALERKIAERLRQGLGYDVDVFIRTPQELQAIAAFAPFPLNEPAPPLPDNVIFLAEPPDAAAANGVLALCAATDEYRIGGREIYWRRRRKPGASPYSTAALEKALRRPFTVRTAATVRTIAAMCRTNKGGGDAAAAVPRRAQEAGRDRRRGARRSGPATS
jgi:uncharacterized protein (DUF1697 family)